jgi:hypothetical protein
MVFTVVDGLRITTIVKNGISELGILVKNQRPIVDIWDRQESRQTVVAPRFHSSRSASLIHGNQRKIAKCLRISKLVLIP